MPWEGGHRRRRGSLAALLDETAHELLGVGLQDPVDLIEQGRFGRMVSYQHYQVGDVTIEEAVNQLRLVAKDSEIVKAARDIGISFGDC